MNKKKENDEEIIEIEKIDLELNIYPVKNHGIPAIEIKCLIQERSRVNELLKKALNNEIITGEIKLKNKWRAIPKLAKMGLIDAECFKDIDMS